MSTIYVVEAGARLEREYERLLVTLHDEVILRVPLGSVSRVVLVGRAGATTAALHALLAAGIPLTLVSRGGKLLGQPAPPMPGNLLLRRAQYGRDGDGDFCLRLARQIVLGKLGNQRTLAGRLARREEGGEGNYQLSIRNYQLGMGEEEEDPPSVPPGEREARGALTAAMGRAAAAADLDTLRGIEGQAARVYFAAYRAAFDPAWGFTKRTRRPPRDPINALLSLGYSLLTQNMMTALEVVGLDPYLGYFHAETYNRPALALDLVEEFRAPVVDSLVLWVVKQRILGEKDFMPDKESGGIVLSDRGLRDFLLQFSKKLESERLVRDVGRRLSYRKLFEVQARRLARVISGEDEGYRAFKAR